MGNTIKQILCERIDLKCKITLLYEGEITAMNIYEEDKTTIVNEGEVIVEENKVILLVNNIYNSKKLYIKDLTEGSLLMFPIRFNFFTNIELRYGPESIEFDKGMKWFETNILERNIGINYEVPIKTFDVLKKKNEIANIEYDRGFTDGFIVGKSL